MSEPREFCPGCEPETDPIKEFVIERWCFRHQEAQQGTADEQVQSSGALLSGSSEAGGEDNRKWCEFLHRRPKGDN